MQLGAINLQCVVPCMAGCSLKYTHYSGFNLHKNMEMCLLSIAGGDELILFVTPVNSLC